MYEVNEIITSIWIKIEYHITCKQFILDIIIKLMLLYCNNLVMICQLINNKNEKVLYKSHIV